ncbi:nuclear transport factor 2 family protein, partial [Rhizobiaceae sp. 2RAB30]
TDDLAVLARLNVYLGVAETNGDRAFLDTVIADQLAFSRANGAVVDRAGYLAAVAPSERRHTDIESIQLYDDRAIVTCIVTLLRTDGEGPQFHNVRMFARTAAGWKLLGWANAPA